MRGSNIGSRSKKKGKCPLVLKDSLDRASDNDGNKVGDRQTLKKSKAGYIEPDDEEAPHIDDGVLNTCDTGEATWADGLLVPKSPSSVSPTEARCQTFLKSLSDDVHYKELLLLLAAKVSNISSVFSLIDLSIGQWTLGGTSSNLGIVVIHWLLPAQGLFWPKVLFVTLSFYTVDWDRPNYCW